MYENAKQRRRWKRFQKRLRMARTKRDAPPHIAMEGVPYWIFLRRKHPVMGCMWRDVARWIRMGRIAAFVTKRSFEFGGAREIEVFEIGDPEIANTEKRYPRCR